MKSKFLTISLVMVLGINSISCKIDPLDDIVSNDRQILSFSVSGQVGPAIISPLGDHEGIIDIYMVMNGLNLSNITPLFEISEYATVNPKSGKSLDFSANESSYTFTVVSESGAERKWTVNLKPFVSEIDGDWIVSSFTFDWWVGKGETWGWGAFGADLSNDFPNAALEEDNTLELITTLLNESGNPEGTFDFGAGTDNEYATFILDPDHSGNARDYSSRYRKLSVGKGVWEYNVAGKILTFWQGNKEGVSANAQVSLDNSGNITISFSNWVDEFTWDHWDSESHIQSSYDIHYNFISQ